MKRFTIVLLAAALVLGAAALSGVGRPGAARGDATTTTDRNLVTVEGTGTVNTVPDRAELSLGVATRGATAKDATDENAAKMRAVLAALRKAGIAERDLQTQELSLEPVYDKGQGVVGYTASNTVAARSEIGASGAVIDAAVAAGANRLLGLSLVRSDRDGLYRDALRRAVDDAKAKAAALAGAGGFAVGEVVSVREGANVDPPVYRSYQAVAADSTPVAAGSQEISATVTVAFAIR